YCVSCCGRGVLVHARPPTPPPVLHPPEWHCLLRAVAAFRSGPQSQPIDPEMFGTKAPRTSRNGQHPTFQTVPAATALSFPPSWISSEVCSACHTLAMLDAGFCPLSAARRTDVLVLGFSAFDQSGPGLRWPSRLVATAEEDRVNNSPALID